MDKIKIKDLEVFCYHGVFKEENTLGQMFLVSAVIYTDTVIAAKTDDLNNSINYAMICNEIKTIMEANTCKLIETVADKIARELLIKYNKIKKVSIEVKKPNPPIPMHMKYISVKIKRSWNKVYIGLGSNLGNKEENIKNAINLIDTNKECIVISTSDLYVTKPVGYTEQDDFLNGCIEINTFKTPLELLEFTQDIENKLGRIRTIKWGPRTIDLDILLYEDKIINSEELSIPHKELSTRGFVLEPLAQIAPNLIHPILSESINNLKTKLEREKGYD